MSKLLKILLPVLIISIAIFYPFLFQGTDIEVNLCITGILQGNVEPFAATSNNEEKLMGGLAFQSSIVNKIRKENKNFLYVSVGDDLPGTSQSFYTQGKSVIDVMNQLGLSAMTIGNREFDFGPIIMEKRIKEASFPIVSSNTYYENGKKPDFLKEFVKIKIDGINFGITGMAPPTTPTEAKAENIKGYIFKDEKYVAETIIPKMRKAGCDIVIVMSQRDLQKETVYLEPFFETADIIIALDYFHEVKKPIIKKEALIIPYYGLSKGKEITVAKLKINKVKKIIIDSTFEIKEVSPTVISADNKLVQKISEYARRIDKIKGRVIGEATCRLLRPFGESTNLGNLVADIMKEITTAEISLQNSGSIRSEIPKGPITVGMIYDFLPFDNDIILMELKGKDILTIVKKAMARKRGLLQISGGKYSYHVNSKEEWIFDSMEINGKPVDENKSYRIATNDFMAGGGSGLSEFKNGINLENSGRLRQVVSNYIEDMKQISGSDEVRIILNK